MYAILVFALLLIPIGYFLKMYWKWKKRADIINRIPGPNTYPILGSTGQLLFTPREKLFETFEGRINEYRPFFRTWMGMFPEIHIMTCTSLEKILTSSVIIEKGYVYTFLHPWLGNGLLTSTGSLWHARRKLITPTFHFKMLETFVDVFTEKSEKLVKILKPVADGQVIDLCPFVTRCALDIICKSAMGVEVNSMEHENADYVHAIYDVGLILLQRGLKPWLVPDIFFYRSKYGKRYKECLGILHGFTNSVIEERKKAFKNVKPLVNENEEDELLGKKKRMAFLDLLLEASEKGANLSNQDIREEVDTFMFEGHDTTTASITWTLFLLGHHPDIQDKVIEEQNEIFGDDKRAPTFQDLSEMKYLERVIKESLRLYPSVPIIIRQLREDIELGQKFALLEEKALISAVIRNFKVKSVQKQEDIRYHSEMILRSQNGIQVQLEPRK